MTLPYDSTRCPTEEELQKLTDEGLVSHTAAYCNDVHFLRDFEEKYIDELKRRIENRGAAHLVTIADGELFRNENSLLPVFAELSDVEIPDLPRRPSREELITRRHAAFLASTGTQNRGLRKHTGSRRTTHCYKCRRNLTTDLDLACQACGWLVCICGACGCGWNS